MTKAAEIAIAAAVLALLAMPALGQCQCVEPPRQPGGWYIHPSFIIVPAPIEQRRIQAAIALGLYAQANEWMRQNERVHQPVDTPYAGGTVRSLPGHPEQQIWMGCR
jgi:hypothetical protein